MLKNAFFSVKKSMGKTILLFGLFFVIANLMIAGLSIQSAITKSMDYMRTSLGSDVTFSYNMKSMMRDLEKGEAMDSAVNSITVEMADQLKDLKYVETYNYTVNVSVSGVDIDPVKVIEEDTTLSSNHSFENDFTVVGNTTMAHLTYFMNKNYVLKSGRLLTAKDVKTKNCVIEKNLANDNDLKIGSTFQVIKTHENNEKISTTLKVVGIYEIKTTNQIGRLMSNHQNPMNQIYTGLSVAQKLNNSMTKISSATYYLDDPKHIDAFKEQAQSSTKINFETYTLDANDQIYQRSVSSLENIETLVMIFLWVVVIAGSVILCLILILTMRSRFYEFGVLLSLGQAKIKIILQQFLEILMIAFLAFILSLGTGKMASHIISDMLINSQQSSQNTVKMNMKDEHMEKSKKNESLFDKAIQNPVVAQLDVSLTPQNIFELGEITMIICVISVILPSIYILRLSPREILIRKEG